MKKREMVRIHEDAAEALEKYVQRLGRTAPKKNAIVSEAIMEWLAHKSGPKAA